MPAQKIDRIDDILQQGRKVISQLDRLYGSSDASCGFKPRRGVPPPESVPLLVVFAQMLMTATGTENSMVASLPP